jgi:hypothetical protein
MDRRFLLLILIAAHLSLVSCGSSDSSQQDSFEGGKLYVVGVSQIPVAELSGTFRQMGRQYGLMMGPQIRQFYKEAVEDLMVKELGWKYEDLKSAGLQGYKEFPQIFRDYLDGTASTNGLGAEKTYIMASMLPLIMETGCSSLSAWNEYTPDRSLVVGRNLDLMASNFGRFAKYFNVVVFNPTGFPASVANIDMVGGLFYQTAINSRGLFLELQNGQISDTAVIVERQNTNNILLESLFINTTSDETDLWFKTTLPQVGLIMNASFPDHASIYEWATFRVARRDGTGLLSASNDYIDPSWKDPSWAGKIHFFDASNEGVALTYTRRTNLLNQGEKNKGNITPQKMMEIFDTTILSGGATFPEDGEAKTIYSVVAQPGQLKIWLKIRGLSGWEEIDLKKYFH